VPELLHLVRHGAVRPPNDGRFLGCLDLPLSEAGQAKARALGASLRAEPDLEVWSSPLQRARMTARAALPDSHVSLVPAAQEVDFGEWEDQRFEEIAAADPEAVDRWAAFDADFAFPGGESLADFGTRLDELQAAIAAAEDERLVLVTHGGVVRGLLCRFLGLSPRQYLLFNVAPGAVATVRLFEGGDGVLERLLVPADLMPLGGSDG